MGNYDCYSYYDKGEISIWIPLIGFDRDQPDKGLGNLLDRMQFKPHDVDIFVCHPDFVHHHEGLEKEVCLHPDCCSYYASPRNEERERQEWTNWDVKMLVDRMNEAGIDTYLSIEGGNYLDLFHHEFATDHPEILQRGRSSTYSINVLKRFKDGTWYEDYFADKICQVLTDYGFTGLHVIDNFCPGHGAPYYNDYAWDMVAQFVAHTGVSVPAYISALGEADSETNANIRADWIWMNHRQAWIEFHAWRWEGFWKKVCARLHEIHKKTFVLGMYCTDPFETLFTKGVDLRRIVRSGVDYLMPNVAASGLATSKDRPWFIYEQSSMVPLTDVHVEHSRKLNMLGVKDGTEEWDMLHHAPNLLERDIYYLLSYYRYTPEGLKRCLDGFNVCLADGIYADEWKWLKERFDIGFCETPEKILLPTVVWSDAAHYDLLPEFIHSRRWPLHTFMAEVAKAGAHTGAMVRIEHLSDRCGDLFVPNFDLLSEDEKRKIAAYTGGAVICTASAEKPLNLEDYGIEPAIFFEDSNTPYRNCAFAWNLNIRDKAAILAHLEEPDDRPGIEAPYYIREVLYPNLLAEMPYQKVSAGFVRALALLLKENLAELVESSLPIIPMQMADGRIRVYGINDDRLHYGFNMVTFHKDIREVKNVSKFPMLPVKFSDDGQFGFTTSANPEGKHTFRLLIPQGGVSIVDVYLQ